VVRATRESKRRPASTTPRFEDLYGGGDNGNLLHPAHDTPAVREAIQRRHARGRPLIDEEGYYTRGKHSWKVPYGVRDALHQPLSFNQTSVKYPFYVAWRSRETGKIHKKYVSCLIVGVNLIATRLQYVDSHAYIVSRTSHYVIPAKLRGKFPRRAGGHTYYWCPGCMHPRRFRRAIPHTEFHAMKKFWNPEKARYDWKEHKLALLKCPYCQTTNHDSKFRASNQPYEKRLIKKGVRRVKSRRPRG
jgi:hypothetical protein